MVRKADRRFEEEKRLRKAWNVERKGMWMKYFDTKYLELIVCKESFVCS